jgi:hypothetical protein
MAEETDSADLIGQMTTAVGVRAASEGPVRLIKKKRYGIVRSAVEFE